MTTYHTTGTVSVTNGSTAVTGNGTDWATALITAGVIYIEGGAYPIASVESNTALTLEIPYAGATAAGLSYVIDRSTVIAEQTITNANRIAQLLGILPTFSEFAGELFDDPNASTALTTLGFSDYLKTLLPAETAAEAREVLQAGSFSANGFRNKIINGNFDIWQRATTHTHIGGGGGYFTADRWLHSGTYTDATVTMSREEFPLGQTDVPGEPQYFMRVNRTATGAGNNGISNRIEDVRTLAGKKQTLTFYARSPQSASIILIYHQDPGTSGGVPGTKQDIIIGTPSVALTPNWQRFDFVVDAPSLAGMVLGTDGNSRIGPSFQLPSESGNASFDLARVSIVEGDASGEPDPFEPRQIAQELALCQRYYWKGQAIGAGALFKVSGTTGLSAMEAALCKMPVRMRVVPTVSIVTDATYTACTNGGLVVFDEESFAHHVTLTAGGRYRAYDAVYEADAEI